MMIAGVSSLSAKMIGDAPSALEMPPRRASLSDDIYEAPRTGLISLKFAPGAQISAGAAAAGSTRRAYAGAVWRRLHGAVDESGLQSADLGRYADGGSRLR
jgi:hypothetical protein